MVIITDRILGHLFARDWLDWQKKKKNWRRLCHDFESVGELLLLFDAIWTNNYVCASYYSLEREKKKNWRYRILTFFCISKDLPLIFLVTKLASPINAINYCHDSSIRAIRFIHTSVSFEKRISDTINSYNSLSFLSSPCEPSPCIHISYFTFI